MAGRVFAFALCAVALVFAHADAAPLHAIEKAPFGRAGDQNVDAYTLINKHGIEASIITYGATLVSLKTPGPRRSSQEHRAGFRHAGTLSRRRALFRRDCRALRQPDCGRQIHARRKDLPARAERWTEQPAWRAKGLRQATVDGRTVRIAGRAGIASHLCQRGRRGGISRPADDACDVSTEKRRHAHHRLRSGHDGAHAGEPREPRLLQPDRRSAPDHSGPCADDQCRQAHAGGRDLDPNRRTASGRGHAVRLPQAHNHRQPDRGKGRAAYARPWLRPQLDSDEAAAGGTNARRRADRSEKWT